MKTRILILGLAAMALVACKKKKTTPEDDNTAPGPATLIFPYDNTECNTGINVTATESTVQFEWSPGENSDSYELVVTNLLSDIADSYPTSETKMPVTINRGAPYAWYVITYSNEYEDTTYSATWKFYNAGDGITSYAPFPAEIVSPAFAEILTGITSVSLDWHGNDVDEDISGYDVYMSTTDPPDLLQADVQQSQLNNVPVSSNTVYYWKVITKDMAGNTSDSGVFQFGVE